MALTHNRAIVVGERSSGVGSIFSFIPVKKYGLLKLKSGLIYLGQDIPIEKVGIAPNIAFDDSPGNIGESYLTELNELVTKLNNR